MKDKNNMHQNSSARLQRQEDGLGPTTDIGVRLRALYGAVQDEGIPDKFLDLLEKLDAAELQAKQTNKGD
jgi:Anti-sigma factor NepR